MGSQSLPHCSALWWSLRSGVLELPAFWALSVPTPRLFISISVHFYAGSPPLGPGHGWYSRSLPHVSRLGHLGPFLTHDGLVLDVGVWAISRDAQGVLPGIWLQVMLGNHKARAPSP